MRPLRIGGAALALLLVVLAGCASVQPPMRSGPPDAEAAPASNRAVARQIQATGRSGRLDASGRTRMLAELGAQGGGDALKRQIAAMARFGDVDLYANNEAKLLIDGPAAFAAMFEAVEQARSTILLQSYLIEDSIIAQRLAELLQRKRAQGVKVFVLYDAIGSVNSPNAFFDALAKADIPSCVINPLNPLQRTGYWNITQRDHRKILSVDRQVAFTGGINISAAYSSGSFGRSKQPVADASKSGWRDTQLRIRGPAVVALDDLVRKTWREQHCEAELPAPSKATPAAAGQQVLRIVPADPDEPVSRIYALLLNAIDASSKSVYLTMAYFAPGEEMIDALCDAARRGVDVELMLPSLSDFAPVLYAGRHQYTRLLAAGVRLYELQDAVLHAKTAVIDGVLSTVGSSNMDWRSFSSNSEVNAVVLGEDFGDGMVGMFRRDVGNAMAIDPQQWKERPLGQRLKETLTDWFERLW